jgi:hypothetical protein
MRQVVEAGGIFGAPEKPRVGKRTETSQTLSGQGRGSLDNGYATETPAK